VFNGLCPGTPLCFAVSPGRILVCKRKGVTGKRNNEGEKEQNM
jgi:hypothetical protein